MPSNKYWMLKKKKKKERKVELNFRIKDSVNLVFLRRHAV